MRNLWLVPALLFSANLHAGIITVRESSIYIDIFSNNGGWDTSANGQVSYAPAGNISEDPNWSVTASVVTNLVDQGGGIAAADDAVSVQLTDVTMECVNPSGCGQTDLGFELDFESESDVPYTGYSYSLDGSGPDVEFQVMYFGSEDFPPLDQVVLGPNYSFAQSGSVAPFSNNLMSVDADLTLTGSSFAYGTTLSLPDSLDITFSTPEPATFGLLALGLGICGWGTRRRRSR